MLRTTIGKAMKNIGLRFNYKYRKGLRRAFSMYCFMFIQKATKKYIITGDPIARKEI
jgi:hypothetical protein